MRRIGFGVIRKVVVMRLFSYPSLRRMMAVGIVTAFVVCTQLPTTTHAALLDNSKAYKRAQKELREGDFEQAEVILRELLAKAE